jgi:hypothetical protein
MFKSSLLFFLFFIPFTTSAYSLINKTVDGHNVKIFHIPNGDNYHVTAVASNSWTTLKNLIETNSWVAGINGAYFIPRDYTWLPDSTNTVRIMNSDWFTYSRYYPDTGINGIFWFLSDQKPILIQNNIYWEKTLRDNYNSWMLLEVRSGIANFPILLFSSINLVTRYDIIWLITPKMKLASTKSFICRTRDNDIKMGTISKISMLDVPSFIGRFGCIDAINLDNGWSLALYDKKKYIVGPGRNIMDAFIIVKQ